MSTTAILPASRPLWTEARVVAEIDRASTLRRPVELLGVRGYYRDSIGVKGRNDRGHWDDALFLVGIGVFLSVNANTDPSPWGVNRKLGKGYAMLKRGTWLYRVGVHKRGKPGGHTALVQAAPVTVDRRLREDDPPIIDTGWFGLNLHCGGLTTTGSEGCQTVVRTQWALFMQALNLAMSRATFDGIIPYTLIEAQG